MQDTAVIETIRPPSISRIYHETYGTITFIDESNNSSGTHKDRMARSIALIYRSMIKKIGACVYP